MPSPPPARERLLAAARKLFADKGYARSTTRAIAAEAGVGGSYFTRILRLGFLSPDIVEAILRNDHPLDLTAKKLAANSRLPIGWQDQRDSLGINAADT